MASLIVHEDAVQLGIVHPVACTITRVRVSADSHSLTPRIEELMNLLARSPETILSRPEVLGFTELFVRMGYPKQKPAGQRLIESFIRNGFKSFNNVVDAYNIVSASFGSGLGMHDMAKISEQVHVFRAGADEQIVPMFKSDPVKVQAGDLVYACRPPSAEGDKRLIAWLGKRDVDSDEFKVMDESVSLLLIALGNRATSREYNREACQTVFDLIRLSCPDAGLTYLDVVFES